MAKAKPLFRGHYQLHVLADLGFYDLRVPEVRDAQEELAREYGIEGFCEEVLWCIEPILRTNTIQNSKERIDITKGQTWERRIREMFELVKEQFNEEPCDKTPLEKSDFGHSPG